MSRTERMIYRMEKKKNKIEIREAALEPTEKPQLVRGKAIVFGSPTVLYTDRFGTGLS